MNYIFGLEVVNKLEGMDLSMVSKYMEEHTKVTEIDQPKQPCQRELIDSPSTAGSRKRSRKR